MCWGDTQVKPIDAEDHAIGLVKYENGAIGQFEVSWTFRGGLDLRDEVMGTEGTIWVNSFLRTGFEMFTTGKGSDYVAEKAESDSGWIFPVGDEGNLKDGKGSKPSSFLKSFKNFVLHLVNSLADSQDTPTTG